MHVQFTERVDGPERLVAEAEMFFDEGGPLAGMKLVGFNVWRSREGEELFVTFPSRAFGAGADRKFFDYLRSIGPGPESSRRLKSWILEQFQERSA
jgi:hypothetical protein